MLVRSEVTKMLQLTVRRPADVLGILILEAVRNMSKTTLTRDRDASQGVSGELTTVSQGILTCRQGGRHHASPLDLEESGVRAELEAPSPPSCWRARDL